MCDIIDLGKLLSQNEKEEEVKAQDDATLPEFLQGGISDEEPFFLVNTETGKRARLVDLFEIEEVEEATILDFKKPED